MREKFRLHLWAMDLAGEGNNVLSETAGQLRHEHLW